MYVDDFIKTNTDVNIKYCINGTLHDVNNIPDNLKQGHIFYWQVNYLERIIFILAGK